MTWEKVGRKVVTKHLLDFNLQEEQPEYNWFTFYRESPPAPLVELVATSGERYRYKPSDDGAREERTQEEMETLFDVDRMVGDEEPQSKRQRRQRRRYIVDGAHRLFTQDLLKASGGIHFGSSLACVVAPHEGM